MRYKRAKKETNRYWRDRTHQQRVKQSQETEVIGVSGEDYVIYYSRTEQKIVDVIRNMTTKDARHIRLSKRQLFRLKKRVQREERIVLKKKTLNKLIQYMN